MGCPPLSNCKEEGQSKNLKKNPSASIYYQPPPPICEYFEKLAPPLAIANPSTLTDSGRNKIILSAL